jgi:hypothetical protein
LQEALIEARAGRKIVFEELVEEKWIAKGKTKETMSNFFDLQTRQAKDYVDTVAARIRRDLEPRKTSRPGSAPIAFQKNLKPTLSTRLMTARDVGFYMHFKCCVLQQGPCLTACG